jgi:hypothetical protein
MVELPKYSGSWGTMNSQESKEEKDKSNGSGIHEVGDTSGLEWGMEKELPALPRDVKSANMGVSSYYDDASDEEEAREESGVSAAKSSSRRIEFNRKLS